VPPSPGKDPGAPSQQHGDSACEPEEHASGGGIPVSPLVAFVMSAILPSPQRSAADHQITPLTQSS
jgi:hypothetical protein